MRPDDFKCGPEPPDGGPGWSLPGIEDECFPRNPRLLLTALDRELVSLWLSCRSGMGGYAQLPDDGGILQQANFVLEVFEACAAQHALMLQLERDERRGSKGQ